MRKLLDPLQPQPNGDSGAGGPKRKFLPVTGAYPIEGDVATYEIPITTDQEKKAIDAINYLNKNPANYTPTAHCATAACAIAEQANVEIPNGLGPAVLVNEKGVLPIGDKVTPHFLNEQLMQKYGPPIVRSPDDFR